MKITWTADNLKAAWSTHTGFGEEGNEYHENACQETVTCTTVAGEKGMGWTAEEALSNARRNGVNINQAVET